MDHDLIAAFDFVNARQRGPRAIAHVDPPATPGGAGGGAPAAPAPSAAPAAPASPGTAPALPPDLAALVANPDAFKARLAEAQSSGQAALAKSLGFAKVDDLKAAVDAHKAAQDAAKTDLQKAQDQVAQLAPKANQADALLATVREILAEQEKAIPEAARGLLDLAPSADDPAARLKWIAAAQARGLFGAAPAAAPATPAPKGATTRPVQPAPPAPNSNPNGKTPAQMNDAEFATFKRTWAAQRGAQNQGGGTQ